MNTYPAIRLSGAFPLRLSAIQALESFVPLPGAYVLSIAGDRRAGYTGRSDSDVFDRLKDHAREAIWGQFWYAIASSAREAFQLECWFWHEYQPYASVLHPDRPAGTWYACPVCREFG